MKVALDYRPALFSRAGIGRYVRELGYALARIPGFDLHLFGHGWKRPIEGEHAGTLHRSRVPGRALPALAWIGLDAPRLAGRPAVFHWTDYVFPPIRRGGPRIVQTVHDVAFLESDAWHGAASDRLRGRFERAVRRADLLLCPSRATERALARHLPGAGEVRVIPFGVDHVHRHQASAERGRAAAHELLGTGDRYLVTVGTLEPRKNHATLLAALSHLAGRGLVIPLICIGGPGWNTARLEQRLVSGNLTFPCAWTGPIADRSMFDLVAAARGMVYPSSLEGFGFPPLEALELGLPVLAGDCAALRETAGDAALFVDGSDPAALAVAIEQLLDEPADARTKAWQQRRRAFTWAECARAHEDAYTSGIEQSA